MGVFLEKFIKKMDLKAANDIRDMCGDERAQSEEVKNDIVSCVIVPLCTDLGLERTAEILNEIF